VITEDDMTPPIPRVWFGLAFFFSFVGVFLIRRVSPDVIDGLAGDLPEPAAIPVLALILMVVGVALQAVWWSIHRLIKARQ
jgi:hypothetical protein